MREQLIQYVNLLFAGAPDAEEIREEILQNTLERYDDLVNHGKSPEAAYRLAITGIGDVNEILGTGARHIHTQPSASPVLSEKDEKYAMWQKKARAVATGVYIASAIPLISSGSIGDGTLGLSMTILMVACATVLIIMSRDKDPRKKNPAITYDDSPVRGLKDSIGSLIWAVGLAVYFIVSFTTQTWYITWLIFPIIGCVNGLINAIIDLKEATKYEN